MDLWLDSKTPLRGATFGSRYVMISGWIKTYSDLFLAILTTYFGGLDIINHHKFHLWLALHQNCQGFHPCPCPYAVVNEQFVRPCQLMPVVGVGRNSIPLEMVRKSGSWTWSAFFSAWIITCYDLDGPETSGAWRRLPGDPLHEATDAWCPSLKVATTPVVRCRSVGCCGVSDIKQGPRKAGRQREQEIMGWSWKQDRDLGAISGNTDWNTCRSFFRHHGMKNGSWSNHFMDTWWRDIMEYNGIQISNNMKIWVCWNF